MFKTSVAVLIGWKFLALSTNEYGWWVMRLVCNLNNAKTAMGNSKQEIATLLTALVLWVMYLKKWLTFGALTTTRANVPNVSLFLLPRLTKGGRASRSSGQEATCRHDATQESVSDKTRIFAMKRYVRLVADNRHLPCATNSWTILPVWSHTSFQLKFTTASEPCFAGLNYLMM